MFLQLNSKELYQTFRMVFPSSTKRKFRHFHVAVVQRRRRQRNVQKMRDARAKLLFYQSKPVAFLPLSLPSRSSLLKLRNRPKTTIIPCKQGVKKVVSDSTRLQKNCEINSAHQLKMLLGLVEMTFGLVYASFSLAKLQALKMTFFAPCV